MAQRINNSRGYIKIKCCYACHRPNARFKTSRYCLVCLSERQRIGNIGANRIAGGRVATNIISRQVRKGYRQKASKYKCADCGKSAHVWEHRDYNKPLAVEPVCFSCNRKRGSAIPADNFSLSFWYYWGIVSRV